MYAESFGCTAAVANVADAVVVADHDWEGSDVDVGCMEDDDYYQWNQRVMSVEVYCK